MRPEDILTRPAKVLGQDQRQFYFENGYLSIERFVPEHWLQRLNAVTEDFVEQSRELSQSDDVFDLEPDHSAAAPRLRRLTAPVEQHEVYRAFTLEGPLLDLAEDLLGPDVKYHHSKLNFKWAEGGEEVKWHQDVPFWPHSNPGQITIGVYLADVDDEMGPLGVIPGSHKGRFFSHYDHDGNWTGAIRPDEMGEVDTGSAVFLPGPAGSVTVHNSWTIHGSVPNHSQRCRNLLLQTYSAADAIVLTDLVARWPHSDKLVRGRPPRHMELEQRPFEMPPDWSGGYTSIFALQQGES